MNKVAKVTIFFWIMKIIATTLGETAGDFNRSLGLGYTLGLLILVVGLLSVLTSDTTAIKI
ncbi:MAG: hypothetical protein V7K48_31895 [Nostoc sp.]|uniref:hypothetical protein n=1 Tax=Nostoc sp. TaxID=1180 RepID=UPI002FF9AE02